MHLPLPVAGMEGGEICASESEEKGRTQPLAGIALAAETESCQAVGLYFAVHFFSARPKLS
jgi:hypothetical protein